MIAAAGFGVAAVEEALPKPMDSPPAHFEIGAMPESDGAILVFASKTVGEQALAWLIRQGEAVVQVIAARDDDVAILNLCRTHGIAVSVFDPERTPTGLVDSGRSFAWLLNLWSPHLLRRPVLGLAHRRLNLHPSLVPHCRGNDNAAWTIRHGLPAGVSLLEMDDGVDTGRVWAQRVIEYAFPIRGRDLHLMLEAELVRLFVESWAALRARPPEPHSQQGPVTCFRRADTNADRHRDAGHTATLADTVRWLLAHDFAPGTTAEMIMDGRRFQVRLDIREVEPGA